MPKIVTVDRCENDQRVHLHTTNGADKVFARGRQLDNKPFALLVTAPNIPIDYPPHPLLPETLEHLTVHFVSADSMQDKPTDWPLRANMPKNSARVMIWKGRSSGPAGHVSMVMRDEDGKYYHVGLYHTAPQTENCSSWLAYVLACCIRPAKLVKSYYGEYNDSDMGNCEHKDPAYIVEIRNLTVSKMVIYFERLDPESDYPKIKWRFLGDMCCCFGNYQNCATLVYDLLKEGDLYSKLMPFPNDSGLIKSDCCTGLFHNHLYSPRGYIIFNIFSFLVLISVATGAGLLSGILSKQITAWYYNQPENLDAAVVKQQLFENMFTGVLVAAAFLAVSFIRYIGHLLLGRDDLVPGPYPFVKHLIKLAADIRVKDISFYKVSREMQRTAVVEHAPYIPPPAAPIVVEQPPAAPIVVVQPPAAPIQEAAASGSRYRMFSPKTQEHNFELDHRP